MHRPDISLLAISALASLAIAGCHEDPPTPIELRSAISSDLGNVLRETNAAVAGSTESLPGTTALAMVDRVLGTGTTLSQQVHTMAAPFVAPTPDAAPATSADAINADAQVKYLNEQLFTDANYLGDGVYQVPASLVCTVTSIDASGNVVKTIDAACADKLAKADLRIRTAREDGALVFAIQVDADHDEPLIITLTHTSIAVTVDLDGAQRAFVALAAVFGVDAPNMDLAGRVTGKLDILGTAKAKLSLTIDRALSIELAKAGADLTGPDAFVLSSAKSEVLSITLDGNAKQGSFALAVGETDLKLPRTTDDKRVELDLPGATVTAAFAAGQPLALTHIGLGSRTTTVSVNGIKAETIDLNPQNGRALDATLSQDAATGTQTFAVTPKLDLERTVDHVVLGDTAPVYDVTGVLLDGSVRTSDTSDQIEVLTGSLGLTTNPTGHGFTAAAGQCVTSSDAIDPTGRSYTQYTVGACL